MSEDVLTDDQSHHEISLTAGQAFVAFVLLLLSLAVTFAFGLVIGKTQPDEHLVARKEPATAQAGALAPHRPEPPAAPAAPANPAFAQLLTTSDQKTAESLAAKLID